jgi:hypothetical protein
MPQEFDDETAIGLFANIPMLEAQRSLEVCRGVSMALGDAKGLAHAAYLVTGSAKVAQSIEIQAMREKAFRNG